MNIFSDEHIEMNLRTLMFSRSRLVDIELLIIVCVTNYPGECEHNLAESHLTILTD